MKLEIDVSSKMMKSLGPIPFFILIFCVSYFQSKWKFPSKKKISSSLGFHPLTVDSSLQTILRILNFDNRDALKGTSIYREFIEFYSKLEYVKFKEFKECVLPRTKRGVLGEYWKYVLEKAEEAFGVVKTSSYNDIKIKSLLYFLKEKVGEENKVDYANWWFRVKAKEKKYFTPGIFFYGGIIDEYLEHKSLEEKKRVSRRKDDFYKQYLEERRKKYKRLVSKGNNITPQEEKLKETLKKEFSLGQIQ